MTSDTLAAQGAPELLPCHRAPQADNSLRHGHAHGKTLRLPPPKSSTGVQMTDLLNCPFCGGAASIRTDTAHSTACLIGCAKIGCFGYEQWEETEDEAIAAWNRRATLTAFAASPEVAKPIAEAEARVMRIAASLFPGGYDNNFAKIEAAALKGAKP